MFVSFEIKMYALSNNNSVHFCRNNRFALGCPLNLKRPSFMRNQIYGTIDATTLLPMLKSAIFRLNDSVNRPHEVPFNDSI